MATGKLLFFLDKETSFQNMIVFSKKKNNSQENN